MSSPHPTATPHAIEQTERKIQEYASLLAKQGTKIVPDIVARLRKLRPRIDGEEITNFLVTIYCPVINQNAALSDNQKKEKNRGVFFGCLEKTRAAIVRSML